MTAFTIEEVILTYLQVSFLNPEILKCLDNLDLFSSNFTSHTFIRCGKICKVFPNSLPGYHDIVHYLYKKIYDKYFQKYNLSAYSLDFTTHGDEIAADTFQELSMICELYNCNGVDKLQISKKCYDLNPAAIVDTSVILLNLKQYHKEICDRLSKSKELVFPEYKNVWESRSGLYPDLLAYYERNIYSDSLGVIDQILNSQNTKYSLKHCLEEAIFALKVFFDLFPDTFQQTEDTVIFTVDPESTIVWFIKETQKYMSELVTAAQQCVLETDEQTLEHEFRIVCEKLENCESQGDFEQVLENLEIPHFGYYLN